MYLVKSQVHENSDASSQRLYPHCSCVYEFDGFKVYAPGYWHSIYVGQLNTVWTTKSVIFGSSSSLSSHHKSYNLALLKGILAVRAEKTAKEAK